MAQSNAQQSDRRQSLGSSFASLTWPLVLGLAATVGFYALLYRGPLNNPLLLRYFAGHPINMIETGLFFIGLAALLLKLGDLLGQFGALAEVTRGDQSARRGRAAVARRAGANARAGAAELLGAAIGRGAALDPAARQRGESFG